MKGRYVSCRRNSPNLSGVQFRSLKSVETSQPWKCCLKTLLSHKIVDGQSKWIKLVIVYFGILCETMALMLTIQRRNCHQYSESCTLSNANSGTITYTANIMFMWQPVTTGWELFSSSQVHSSYIYWYAQKENLGRTLLILEKYIFIFSCIYYFLLLFYCQ